MARKDYTPEQAIGMLREAEGRQHLLRSWDLGTEPSPVAPALRRAEG